MLYFRLNQSTSTLNLTVLGTVLCHQTVCEILKWRFENEPI